MWAVTHPIATSISACMGMHDRLGESSALHALNNDLAWQVMRMSLNRSCSYCHTTEEVCTTALNYSIISCTGLHQSVWQSELKKLHEKIVHASNSIPNPKQHKRKLNRFQQARQSSSDCDGEDSSNCLLNNMEGSNWL